MSRPDAGTLICTHDDRPQAATGIKLLLLSLADHCPDLDILVSWPQATGDLAEWLKVRPNVQHRVEPAYVGKEWNVKPDLLMHCLDQGYREVIWLDSDVIVARDFRDLFADAGAETLVVAEDFYWAAYVFFVGTARAELWGLRPGRSMPYTANTGVLRVTPAHRPLLRAWDTLLASAPYVQAHRRAWYSRPVHLVGDQDVLTALLSSQHFGDVPVRFLHRGKHIIYNFGPSGYTLRERLANLNRPTPPFAHCSGPKPWDPPRHVSLIRSPRQYYARVGLELADYTRVARRYREHFAPEAAAFDVETTPARLFHWLAGKHIPLQGLPLALLHGFGRRVRKALGYNYWPHLEANIRAGERPDGEAILRHKEAERGG